MKRYLVAIENEKGASQVEVLALNAEDARQKAKKENNAWSATTLNRIRK